MKKREFHRLIERYEQGIATQKEKQLLDEFYQSFQTGEGDKYHLLDAKKDQLHGEIYATISKRLFGKEEKTPDTPLPSKEMGPYQQMETWRVRNARSIQWRRMAVAASVILIAMVSFLIYEKIEPEEAASIPVAQINRVTEKGQKLMVRLADGTMIHLNADSWLSFPQKFTGDERRVRLVGEAFFEVAKDPDKPFIVETEHISTTVLGTEFNVYAVKGERAAVTLVEGRVKVQQGANNVYLEPDDRLTYDPEIQELKKQVVNTEKWTAWKEGVLTFDHMTVVEVIPVLEKWYGVTITLENAAIGKCMISSGTYKNESLEHVLQSFRLMFNKNIDFEIENKEVMIKGNPCNNP